MTDVIGKWSADVEKAALEALAREEAKAAPATPAAVDSDPRWFAVMSHPRQEALADRHLRAAGYWTFFPFCRTIVRHARQRREIEVPYLPRYLFVAVRPGQSLYPVNSAVGVSTIVYHGREPLQIPPDVMDELMERADSAGLVVPPPTVPAPAFRRGERVRFNASSPLAGLLAEVARIEGAERIRVWVRLFGRTTEAVVQVSEVERIARKAPGR